MVEFAGWLNLKLDQLVSFLQKEMQWQDCVVNDGLLRIPSSLADSNRMVKSNVIMESLKFERKRFSSMRFLYLVKKTFFHRIFKDNRSG